MTFIDDYGWLGGARIDVSMYVIIMGRYVVLGIALEV